MLEDDDEIEVIVLDVQENHEAKPRKKRTPVGIKIPRRVQSAKNMGSTKIPIMTAGIKPKPIKLRQCVVSPLTLYDLSAAVVDKLNFPQPFEWDEVQVAEWMGEVVGLPQYKECMIDNHINGRRLLRLEDPSVLPEINIHDFEHIKKITAAVRKVFATDYVLFARSVGLPFRKPLTYCTWFKSRTGTSGVFRQSWARSDLLRWMKIILPKPLYPDHWDLVWYLKPDWPKQMVARIPRADLPDDIPRYIPPYDELCNEYLAPRKFIVLHDIPSEDQYIWMEHLPGSPSWVDKKRGEEKAIVKKGKVVRSRLVPKRISLNGLAGKDLILARRKMAKPKFLP